jgi:hypothetical protein
MAFSDLTMKATLAGLMVLVLMACTTEIELQQPDYTPKLVVDGTIESDDFAQVFLTRSSPFLTEYDSVSIRLTFVNTATVTLTCSNGDSEVLTLFRQNQFFPPFCYRSIRMKGIPGQTYTLDIRSGGKVVTATTSLPQPPSLKGLKMVAHSDTSCRLLAEVSPLPLEKEYLYISYRSVLADRGYHPSGVPVFRLDPASDTAEVPIYRCDETNLYLLNGARRVYSGWPKNDFSLVDTVFVKVGRVDARSYQILKSLFADQSVKNNPFAFNSAGIQTNIVGGIGRWTGIATAPLQVFIHPSGAALPSLAR